MTVIADDLRFFFLSIFCYFFVFFIFQRYARYCFIFQLLLQFGSECNFGVIWKVAQELSLQFGSECRDNSLKYWSLWVALMYLALRVAMGRSCVFFTALSIWKSFLNQQRLHAPVSYSRPFRRASKIRAIERVNFIFFFIRPACQVRCSVICQLPQFFKEECIGIHCVQYGAEITGQWKHQRDSVVSSDV